MKMTRLLTVEDIAQYRHGPNNDIDLEVGVFLLFFFIILFSLCARNSQGKLVKKNCQISPLKAEQNL